MQKIKIDQGDWVVVCDGKKALILENVGDWKFPNLQTREVFEQDNPPTHEQGSDAPGRSFQSVGSMRSAMEQTDWHEKAEEDFLQDLAGRLDAAIGAGDTHFAGDGRAAARARDHPAGLFAACARRAARRGGQGFREDAGARDREASHRHAENRGSGATLGGGDGRWRSAAADAKKDCMANVFYYLVPVALGAVAVVLVLGLINMMRGGSPNTSQKLMRLRVLFQFVALVVIMITLWLMGR